MNLDLSKKKKCDYRKGVISILIIDTFLYRTRSCISSYPKYYNNNGKSKYS